LGRQLPAQQVVLKSISPKSKQYVPPQLAPSTEQGDISVGTVGNVVVDTTGSVPASGEQLVMRGGWLQAMKPPPPVPAAVPTVPPPPPPVPSSAVKELPEHEARAIAPAQARTQRMTRRRRLDRMLS
jgi:hypothetical protein